MAYDAGLPCLSDAQWSARKRDEESADESLLLCTYHYEVFLLNTVIEPGGRLST